MATLLQQYSVGSNAVWLDELPEVGVETSDRSVRFTFSVCGESVYQDTLYPFQGKVRVDMRTLVSERMLIKNIVYARLTFTFTDSAGSVTCYLNAIRRRIYTSATLYEWCDSRFLTLARGKYMPYGMIDMVTAYIPRYESAADTDVSGRIDVQYRNADGDVMAVSSDFNPVERDAVATVQTFAVSWPELPEGAVPIMMTVTLEGRSLTYYHTDMECTGIRFINAFGAPENMFEPVGISYETKVSSSVAMIRLQKHVYDLEVNQALSLTFRACNTSDYAYICQLAESPEIKVWTDCRLMPCAAISPAGGLSLIADSCEYSADPDSESALIPVIKCHPTSSLPISPDIDTRGTGTSGIFTSQFTKEYQ
ncbi:MAG: hypothetical protein K2H86_07720 [Muribaculaceae bacterium]|nr:hypothetical protein [Muribaculaceae bacterium]